MILLKLMLRCSFTFIKYELTLLLIYGCDSAASGLSETYEKIWANLWMSQNLCGKGTWKRKQLPQRWVRHKSTYPALKTPGTLNNVERRGLSRGAQDWYERKQWKRIQRTRQFRCNILHKLRICSSLTPLVKFILKTEVWIAVYQINTIFIDLKLF